MESLKELIDRRAKLIHDNRAVLDRADAEKRSLNSEERGEYDAREKDIEGLSDQISARRGDERRRERAQSHARVLEESAARQTPPSAPGSRPGSAGDGAPVRLGFGRAGELDLADVAQNDPRLAESLRARAGDDYRRNFLAYLRGEGVSRNFESLGLQVGNDPQGGFLAPMSFVSQLIKFLDDAVTVRQYATVLPPTTAKSVGVLSYDTDYADADWTAEIPASDLSEDDAARFGGREMMPHLLSKLVKTSRKMLRSSTLPLDTFLASRLAYKFAITENKAYMTGSGSQRPLGLFVASSHGIPTTRDTVCASATAFTFDEVIELKESVKDVYQQNGTFLAHRDFRKRCRKLKDGNGNYLLSENNADGVTTLLERPLVVDENAPNTFTASQYVCVFGDLSYYWIQDGIDLEIQRLDELLALRNQVGWIGRKETDAQPVLAEAFGRMRMA